jgi:niacin transporter
MVLIGAAAALPVIAHLSGAPVRWLLPMHWPVLLAGLVYGWRSGLLVGAAAPGVSFLISGMPFPFMIPAMTIELAVYGFVAGIASEKFKLSKFSALISALVIGRLFFIAMVLIMQSYSESFTVYLQAAVLPGLITAAAQAITLPFIARWWVKRSQ